MVNYFFSLAVSCSLTLLKSFMVLCPENFEVPRVAKIKTDFGGYCYEEHKIIHISNSRKCWPNFNFH